MSTLHMILSLNLFIIKLVSHLCVYVTLGYFFIPPHVHVLHLPSTKPPVLIPFLLLPPPSPLPVLSASQWIFLLSKIFF